MEGKRSSKMRSLARVLSRRSVVDASTEQRSASAAATNGGGHEGVTVPSLSSGSPKVSSKRRPPPSPSYPGATPSGLRPRTMSSVSGAVGGSSPPPPSGGAARRFGRTMTLRRFGRSSASAAAAAAAEAAASDSPTKRASHPGAVAPSTTAAAAAAAGLRSSVSEVSVRGSTPEALGAGKDSGSHRDLGALLRRRGGGGGGGGRRNGGGVGGDAIAGVTRSDAFAFDEESPKVRNAAFGTDAWNGDEQEPSILPWRKGKVSGTKNDILRTATVRKREINSKLMAELPRIVLAPYGDGDWARDVVVFLHNAMRREFMDLYALLDVMQRKKSLLTHDVIESFFDWWADFQAFCLAAINAATDEVFPPITAREPITHQKVRQSSRMLTNGRFLVILQKITDYQSQFSRSRPAGEMLPGLLALVDELSFIHAYWAALEELIPPVIAVHFCKRDKALWERRIAAHVRRGNNYDLNMALLGRWLSTAAEAKWKVANLRTSEHFTYGTWVREAERVHYRILKNFENRLVSEDESERVRSIGVAMAVAPEWRERLEQSKTSTVELTSNKAADAAKAAEAVGAPAAPTGAAAASAASAGTASRTSSSVSGRPSVGGDVPPPPEKPAPMVPRAPVVLINSSMA